MLSDILTFGVIISPEAMIDDLPVVEMVDNRREACKLFFVEILLFMLFHTTNLLWVKAPIIARISFCSIFAY
jgi:hypothetical protein